MVGLDRLAIGDRARVARIIGADEITARLFEMGLTPGVMVALIGCAPLSIEPAQDRSGSR
jgi:Fe2+ transport system protein FeoA